MNLNPFGSRLCNISSAPAGVYSATPSVSWPFRLEMFVVMSRRKHVLSVLASSAVSGGVRRVFTVPAIGTFTINPRARLGLIRDEFDDG
jgi:hypothetical protein